MIPSIRHKQSISWTFLNDAMALSVKEMPIGRITLIKSVSQPPASSCISRDGDLNFYFSRAKDGVVVPLLYQPTRSTSRRVSNLNVSSYYIGAKGKLIAKLTDMQKIVLLLARNWRIDQSII